MRTPPRPAAARELPPAGIATRSLGARRVLRRGRQLDRVARAHRFVRDTLHVVAPIGDPRLPDLGLDLVERRGALRRQLVDPDQMPAEARLDRPAPRPRGLLEEPAREVRTEALGDLFGRSIG